MIGSILLNNSILLVSDDKCKTWKTINTPRGGNILINDISINDDTIYIIDDENMFKLKDGYSEWQIVNTPTINTSWIGMDNRIGFSIYTKSGDIYFKSNENEDYKLSVNLNSVPYNVLGTEYILTSSGLWGLD